MLNLRQKKVAPIFALIQEKIRLSMKMLKNEGERIPPCLTPHSYYTNNFILFD